MFNFAKDRGASEKALWGINQFIEDGMRDLVHNISVYFDDAVKRYQMFTALLESRNNEAIWTAVFTFFFNDSELKNVPTPLAVGFVKHFWNCYFLCHPTRTSLDQLKLTSLEALKLPSPYYYNRIIKILEKVCGVTSIGGRKYYNDEWIRLFEQHSRQVAEDSSPDRKSEILEILEDRSPSRVRDLPVRSSRKVRTEASFIVTTRDGVRLRLARDQVLPVQDLAAHRSGGATPSADEVRWRRSDLDVEFVFASEKTGEGVWLRKRR